MVGICQQHQKLTAYPGGPDHHSIGWSYYGCSPGYVYHNSKNKDYGEAFRMGDTVTVTVDMDEGTLSYSKNRIDLGFAATNGIQGLLYCFASHLTC